MNKKILIISLFITCVSIGITYFLFNEKNVYVNENPIGNFLFEKTNKQGTNINKIVIKFPKLQISLYYQDKFWRVKEADGYYADLMTVNQLFQDINQAKIEALPVDITAKEAEVSSGNDAKGIQIKTYNEKGKLLDFITIGKKKNEFRYASEYGKKQIYLISGNFDLPDRLYYWLQQPIVSILPDNIEKFIIQSSTGQQLAYRLSPKTPFFNLRQKEVNVIPLLDKFVYFSYKNVKQIKNTPLDSLKPDRIIVLFPYSGLIYGFEIFKIEGEYWVKIDLSITKLPTRAASDYIKDSQFLYQGWAFKIDKNLGEYLINYKIN